MKTLEHNEKEAIAKIISKCDVCFVGMSDANGIPYVLPMNFGYENDTVYLHSAQDGHSIDILNQNPNVCIAFNTKNELVWQDEDVACSYRMRSASVIAWGKVEFEEDFDRKVEALNILMRQYSEMEFTYGNPSVRNVKIWRVKIERISCKEFGVPHKK